MRSMKNLLKVAAVASALTVAFSTVSLASYWNYDGTYWEFCDDNGHRVSGNWVTWEGNWYHLNNIGHMDIGWFQDGVSKDWYYANDDGSMRTADLVENGVVYHFAANGVCTNR